MEQGGAINKVPKSLSEMLGWGYSSEEVAIITLSLCPVTLCTGTVADSTPINYPLDIRGGREQDIGTFIMLRLDLKTQPVCSILRVSA